MRNVLDSFLRFFEVRIKPSNEIESSILNLKTKPSLPEQRCGRFSLDEIRSATCNFDPGLVTGKGGSGVVYKGLIDDGALPVAVKRLSPSSFEVFRNEVQLRHQHLVSLIGFCDEEEEMILVYDYMTNGSLYDHLHGSAHEQPLSWKQRSEICIGAARGLHYLHTGAKRAVIHRDIKSNNILLDDRRISKLSDFGLSKIGPFSMSNAPLTIEMPSFRDLGRTTKIYGTLGYMDPEFFFNTRLVTDKSDVYSFGVVLFEVLCGRKVFKFDGEEDARNLLQWVSKRIKNGTIYHAIDPYLEGKIAPRCLEKFLEIAFSCVRDQGNKRPAIGEVEETLELALELQNKADSEMECINPNGEGRYKEVLCSASAFDFSDYGNAYLFLSLGSTRVDSFRIDDTFSDIEDMQHGTSNASKLKMD